MFHDSSIIHINCPQVTTVRRYAFENCYTLQTLLLPNAVQIDETAFGAYRSQLKRFSLHYNANLIQDYIQYWTEKENLKKNIRTSFGGGKKRRRSTGTGSSPNKKHIRFQKKDVLSIFPPDCELSITIPTDLSYLRKGPYFEVVTEGDHTHIQFKIQDRSSSIKEILRQIKQKQNHDKSIKQKQENDKLMKQIKAALDERKRTEEQERQREENENNEKNNND